MALLKVSLSAIRTGVLWSAHVIRPVVFGLAIGRTLISTHGLRRSCFSSRTPALTVPAVLPPNLRKHWIAFTTAVFAFVSSTLAEDNPSAVQLFQARINVPFLGLADPLFLYGGCALLAAGAIFAIMYWRSKHSPVQRPTPRPVSLGQASSRLPVLKGIDLQLLWFMSDENAAALPAQIERYIAAFEGELQLTHAAVLSRAPREIHRSAHRLVAHSAATNYKPLHQLATKLQSEAATLNADQLDRLMSDVELRFAELKKTLRAIRLSTERA